MRRASFPLLLSAVAPLLFLAAAPPVGADDLAWEWTGGPEGGSITSLIVTDSGVLLAGAENGGLFRSTDGGMSWTSLMGAIGWPCCNYGIPSLASGGAFVYAGTWGGGLIRSADNGETWEATGEIPGDSYPIVTALATCRYGSRVYAGGNFGVARSDDSGDTWTAIGAGLPAGWVWGLALNGTTLYARLATEVYRLDPEGWVAANDGLVVPGGHQSIGTLAGGLFLSTHDGGVFHLDCDGSAWQEMNTGLYDDNVDCVVQAGPTLYAGLMGGGAYRWDGSLWSEINSGLSCRDIRNMAAGRSEIYAGTFSAGVHALDPGTGEWQERNGGLVAPEISDLLVDGPDLWVATYGGGVHRSTDQGTTWARAAHGLNDLYNPCLAGDGSAVYAGSWNGVWRTTDHGGNWSQAGLLNHGVFSLMATPGALYAGLWEGEVQVSTDSGDSWAPVGTGLPAAPVVCLARLGSTTWAGLNGAGVWRLADGQPTWIATSTGLPEQYIGSMTAWGGALYLGLESHGVWRWNDTTQQWDDAGLENRHIFCLEPVAGRLMAGSWGELNATGDGGLTWLSEHSGLREWQAVRALADGTSRYYAGLGGGGVWRAQAVSGGPAAPASPPIQLMMRAAPNPLGGAARIFYDLDLPGPVALGVFDAAGRKVATLVDGWAPAGHHVAAWGGPDDQGGSAASGIYWLRLESAGRTVTTQIVLAR